MPRVYVSGWDIEVPRARRRRHHRSSWTPVHLAGEIPFGGLFRPIPPAERHFSSQTVIGMPDSLDP